MNYRSDTARQMADTIRRSIAASGLSVSGWARARRVDKKQVQRALSGEHSPTLSTITSLANAVGVPTWQLLTPDPDPELASRCESRTPAPVFNMGARVKQVLAERGWRQIDLLNRVPDLEPATLSALISRDAKTCWWSDQIAEALGVRHRWLQNGEGPRDRSGEWPFSEELLERVLELPALERARIVGYIEGCAESCASASPQLR